MGKLKLKLSGDVMRLGCILLLIVSILLAAPSFAQKLPADLQNQVDKGFLTREEAELLNRARGQSPALTQGKNANASKTHLCSGEDKAKYEKEQEQQESSQKDGDGFRSYIAKLRRNLQRNWQSIYITTANATMTRPVIVAFDINRGGNVENLVISCSSGNRVVDQAAVSAISTSAPFDPFPDAYKQRIVNATILYNAPM